MRTTSLAVLAIVCGALGLVLVASAGCSWLKSGPEPAVIDCTKQAAPQLLATIATLKQDCPSATGFGGLDWACVETKAISAGKVIGGCALAELVQQYLSDTKLTAEPGSWAPRDALEHFRHDAAGNATFHTASGDL